MLKYQTFIYRSVINRMFPRDSRYLQDNPSANSSIVSSSSSSCSFIFQSHRLRALLGPHVVAESVLHIDEAGMPALGNLVDGREVLVAEVDGLEVAVDPAGRRALGEHDVTSPQTPGDQHLSEGVATLFGDAVERGVGVNLLARCGDLVLRAERRVGGGHDVVLEAEVDELRVGQEGVDLNLVELRLDLTPLEHVLEAVDGPVGDANGLDLTALVQLFHRPPRRLRVLGELLLDDVLALVVQLGHVLIVLFGSDRPVDKEEVDVFELQPVERALQRPFDLVGLVEVVPHLGADEDVLAADIIVVLAEVAHGVADLVLVLVEPGAVEVAVALLQGVGDGLVCLALGTLCSEGTETNSGDGHAVVKLVGLSVRHCEVGIDQLTVGT